MVDTNANYGGSIPEYYDTCLVRLCYKASSGLRGPAARATRESLQQRARQALVGRGDGGRHMAFRPDRERPAA
jgi:hypothetical protein